MTKINPAAANPVTDRNSPNINTTLNRLGRALTIRGASGDSAAQPGDSVQISQSAASASATPSVTDLRVLLADLETLVSQAAQDNAGADVRVEAQRSIDEAVAVISGVASQNSAGGVQTLTGYQPYAISNLHEGIGKLNNHSGLEFRERVDVEIVVTQSAQRGGLFLSLGGAAIDLGTGSSFIFEVGGVLGSRTLSFASGTTIADIAAAINTFTDVTHAQATVSGTGIRIESKEARDDALVTVQVIDDGAITAGDGIHRLTPDDASVAEIPIFHTYASAKNSSVVLIDNGQGVAGTVNGKAFSSKGSGFSASLLEGRLFVHGSINTFDKSNPLVPFNTPFHAFTIIGGAQTDSGGPIDDVSLGDSPPISQALAPFTTSGDSAGDFIAALDAIRSLRDQFGGGGVTDGFLADLRRDLIAQAGASLGVTTKSESQQALDLLGGATT